MIAAPRRPPRPVAAPALLALLALLAVVAGCASGGADALLPGPDRARASLSEGEIDAVAEILMLEDHRRFDPDAFERLAGSASEEVRRRAVTAAGRIGDRAAAPLLLAALSGDPAAAVRADAAFALGELGDTSAAVLSAFDAISPPSWVPVREPDVTVMVEALGALGKLGSRQAGRLIGDALLETYPAGGASTRRVAAEALMAAWRLGDAAPVPRIAPFLDTGDDDLRWRAAYALMRSGRADALPYLLRRAGDPAHRVRAYAVRALGREPAESAGVADSARIVLARAIGDEHPHVRINALNALASYGDDAPLARMAAAVSDPDPHVAIAAAAALGRLGPRAADALAAAAENESVAELGVRATALAGLAGLDAPRARAVAERWSGGELRSRYMAARTLAPLGPGPSRGLLESLASDPDPRVAIAALDAAATFASDTSLAPDDRGFVRTLLLERVRAEDLRVAAAATAAVAPVAGPEDRDALLEAYGRAAGDDTPAGRAAAIAAVRALGALEAREPGAAAAFFRRHEAAADRWIRRAVADTLGTGWGEPPAPVAAEDPAFYRDIVRRYIAAPLGGEARPVAVVRTGSGTFEIELLAEEAPLTVANFVRLASEGFYDGGVWHRVVPNFVLQDGAPAGHPSGGPGWAIRDEINRSRYDRGTVGMALSGPDTGGSQWFITHSPQPHLDGGYTVFGRVSSGMKVADGVVQGEPILSIGIRR